MSRMCIVTGAAGFIGSHLTQQLMDAGWLVIGIDAFTDSYDPSEKVARAELLKADERFTFIEGDLLDVALDPAVAHAEVVFHLAGRAGVRASFESEDKYIHDNIEVTHRLIDACTRAPSVRRLVYASSSSIYGNGPRPFRETGPTAPISPYGRSKLAAEVECLEAVGQSLEAVALRYFTVYGPRQRPDMGLRIFAEAALDGRPIILYGDGTQSRDFTYVEDVVRATIMAADAPVSGLVINVGGGAIVSLLDVLELLRNFVGPIEVETHPVARGDVSHTEADHTRARELLGFQAQVLFSEGYRRQIEYLRDRRTERASS